VGMFLYPISKTLLLNTLIQYIDFLNVAFVSLILMYTLIRFLAHFPILLQQLYDATNLFVAIFLHQILLLQLSMLIHNIVGFYFIIWLNYCSFVHYFNSLI